MMRREKVKAREDGRREKKQKNGSSATAVTLKTTDDHESVNSMVPKTGLSQKESPVVNTNKQRCLLVGTRLMSSRERSLLHDFHDLIPHGILSNKVTVPYGVSTLMKELITLHNCNTCLVMRVKKKQTILWISQGTEGPSVSFSLSSVYPASGMKFNGNCLKYSRPLLHFDSEFEKVGHLRAIRTLLNMVFGTPRNHPKSKPFIDHIYCFFYYDGIIWFRHYQISIQEKDNFDLLEIGPRFALAPIALMDGSFRGNCIWKSSCPRKIDEVVDRKHTKAQQYMSRKEAKLRRRNREKVFPPVPNKEDLLFS